MCVSEVAGCIRTSLFIHRYLCLIFTDFESLILVSHTFIFEFQMMAPEVLHLERVERQKIAAFLRKDLSLSKVARAVQRGKSTIRREITNGTVDGEYSADVAHHNYLVRLYSARLGRTQGNRKPRKFKLSAEFLRKARAHRLVSYGFKRLDAIVQKYKAKGAKTEGKSVAKILSSVRENVYAHMRPQSVLDKEYVEVLHKILNEHRPKRGKFDAMTEELFEVIEIQVKGEGLDERREEWVNSSEKVSKRSQSNSMAKDVSPKRKRAPRRSNKIQPSKVRKSEGTILEF